MCKKEAQILAEGGKIFMEYRILNKKVANLNNEQLENYLEKMASDHILQNRSDANTYPIPNLKDNFEFILKVYNLLNEHIKLGIPIHPAGEWLLDNFYIIEETVKGVIKGLPLNKYKKFLAIANGPDKGFARIYVLCSEIISYMDYKIDIKTVINLISSYQKKKSLSMEEIWNISLFMDIALVQAISEICEKIYFSQMQKYRVENIIERLVENKEDLKYKNLSEYKANVKGYGEMKYPFIEYMSFKLKKYGKSGLAYINALEEQVNKMGTTIDEVVKKEHFDIALKRVSMANAITSIKEISRINFQDIFEKINGVEEILRKDPAGVYEKMDYKTKEYYRNTIKEISKKTKMSEIYIARSVLELCVPMGTFPSETSVPFGTSDKSDKNNNVTKLNNVLKINDNPKLNDSSEVMSVPKGTDVSEGNVPIETHVGYYLVGEGLPELYKKIGYAPKNKIKNKTKVNFYIYGIWFTSIILDALLTLIFYRQITNVFALILFFILVLIPMQEITNKFVQYILRKIY